MFPLQKVSIHSVYKKKKKFHARKQNDYLIFQNFVFLSLILW